MAWRERFADGDIPFDPEGVTIDDAAAFELLEPVVQEWWLEAFGEFVPQNGGFFTPPQKEAIPLIHEGTNALVCSPTGSGKTLSAFTSIINELFGRGRAGGLENSVYCLYVSPLKSLANDIHRNLQVPLEGITERLAAEGEAVDIRHAIRHGDTGDSERQRMLEETPHILNTTPETLAILLDSPKFKEKSRTVEYVDSSGCVGAGSSMSPSLDAIITHRLRFCGIPYSGQYTFLFSSGLIA